MLSYLLQRVLLLLPTLIGVTCISFAITHLAPGDPAELRAGGGLGGAGAEGLSSKNRGALDQALAAWRAQYGLDQSLPTQYWRWPLRRRSSPTMRPQSITATHCLITWRLDSSSATRSPRRISNNSNSAIRTFMRYSAIR